jgi:S23 ribosomal protein.
MAKIESFEDLECYRSARALRRKIATWAGTLPKTEEYRLKDQVLRAARSVTANIAEGFGRQHPQENLQYCRQARGSLCELLDHLNVAVDENFIDQTILAEMREAWSETKGILGGYISYLETRTTRDRRFLTRADRSKSAATRQRATHS